MVQNWQSDQQATTPAAQIRVPAEELSAAINVLEGQRAQRLQGTVPIGEVVQELQLSATPEEIWAQVQKQRQSAAQAVDASQYAPWVSTRAPRRRRGWWVFLGIVAVVWVAAPHNGVRVQTAAPVSPVATHPSSSITISGDGETETCNAQGKNVEISGDGSTVHLHGKPLSVIVTGDGDTITTDAPENVETDGDADTVISGSAPSHAGPAHP